MAYDCLNISTNNYLNLLEKRNNFDHLVVDKQIS